MRNHGPCPELLRLKPHDHIGWAFSGSEEFDELVRPFLAEGASASERLMYVAEDPDTERINAWAQNLPPGILTVASVAEVYGASGLVDSKVQRATFASALAEALDEGYRGIRVAADNTSLVVDEERVKAWVQWEIVADDFMSANRVTGLCAFDRDRVNIDTLRHLATLHPLSRADSLEPQFRLFSSDGALWVEGEVNAFAVEQVRLALTQLPAKTKVVIDLSSTAMLTPTVFSEIRSLCEAGIHVVVRNASDSGRQMAEAVGVSTSNLGCLDDV